MKEKDELMAYQLLIPHLVNAEALCRPALPQWRKEFPFFSFSICVRTYWEGQQYIVLGKLMILRNYTYIVREERDRSLSNSNLRRLVG